MSLFSRPFRPAVYTLASALLLASLSRYPILRAQTEVPADAPPAVQPGSSSSSSPDAPTIASSGPRIAQIETGGSAITLETSQPLFYLSVALNACGYDNGLVESSAIRTKVRDELNEEFAASAPARESRDALCTFVRQHALSDPGHSVAQYVSLALYLTPAPLLTPTADVTELPAEAASVVEVLPLVRTFAEATRLNALWVEHRPEYEALTSRIHDPLTHMVLNTNIYLHLPVSSYDGRRFVVLVEPMLAPSATNARYDGNDSVVVVSPRLDPAAPATLASVPMDLIRHAYLHFTVEPLVYARAAAMDRLLPLLKPVQQAPLEFTYKADIVALLTECLIKSIEAQTMEVGLAKPAKPTLKDRSDAEHYDAEMTAYDRQAEAVRRRTVEHDMRQGWVLVDYFYAQLAAMQKEGISLKDNIGPMIYGMDVERERHHDEQIAFLPEGSGGDLAFRGAARHTKRPITGLDLAEIKLMKGDAEGAEEMADAALKSNPANPDAHYLLGRIDLMQGDPDAALNHLTQTVQLSHDPRTIAWAHIYLGRMYDIAHDPENPEAIKPQRDKAIAEYRAALANRDSQPDTKSAAEKGIKQAFAPPQRTVPSSDIQSSPDNDDLDPSGKAAKEAYRSTRPQ